MKDDDETTAKELDVLIDLQTVTIDKCRRYINHLRKVIPRIIELNGDATGCM